MQKKSIFSIEKIQKYLKCPALLFGSGVQCSQKANAGPGWKVQAREW